MKLHLFFLLLSVSASLCGGQVLCDFSKNGLKGVESAGHAAAVVENGRLVMTGEPYLPGRTEMYPFVTLRPPEHNYFDFSEYAVLAADVENLCDYPVSVVIQIDADGRTGCAKGGVALNAREKHTLKLRYPRNGLAGPDVRFEAVRERLDGFPDERHIDAAKVPSIRLLFRRPGRAYRVAVSNIRLEEPYRRASVLAQPEKFYPCFDRFGQYRHAEWPGKLHSEKEFNAVTEAEDKDLAAYAAATHEKRTVYGGWADGPSLEATGHFRTAKYGGKWYLVDPEGKLFWSFGIDCIYPTQPTPLDLRHNYFEWIPSEGDPVFGRLFGRTGTVYHPFYREREIRPRTFDFYAANLIRKYGADYRRAFADRAAKRLGGWGFNTVGNWSVPEVIAAARKPYVAQVYPKGGRKIAGDRSSRWYAFWDVFDPSFQECVEKDLKSNFAFAVNDPFCIGFFVDNELSHYGETGLSDSVLRSPADQPAKRAFLDMLRKRYVAVAALNAAWGTAFRDWDAFLASASVPETEGAANDQREFNALLIESYYRRCRDAIRSAAPGKLYLGSRFAGFPHPVAVRNESKYADVVTINHYLYSVAHIDIPADRPILIGEFHFGTMSRGPASPGIQPAADQNERARAFERYVESALYNPKIIGVHYFKYADQPSSGRNGDGENMQIGFVDFCDTPFPEMIAAARRLGEKLYRYRAGTAAR
ncbi:MAG: hypothetical protein HPZ91_03465 [Lentisphaeria bacterium]|nr:hypothetical protein [Lentisphaeria bacterium]